MKKAVGGKSRVDLAVDQIIQVILDRDMKAGDKLPNEYDLARELGVGAYNWSPTTSITRRFISSGHGRLMSPVRSPAST